MDELINQTEGSLYLGLGLEVGRSANLAASVELKREHLAVQGNALEVTRLRACAFGSAEGFLSSERRRSKERRPC